MKKKLRFFDGVLKELYERNGVNEVQHEEKDALSQQNKIKWSNNSTSVDEDKIMIL